MLEQLLTNGILFQLDDIHHETFVIASFALGIGVILDSKLSKNRENLDLKPIFYKFV